MHCSVFRTKVAILLAGKTKPTLHRLLDFGSHLFDVGSPATVAHSNGSAIGAHQFSCAHFRDEVTILPGQLIEAPQ